MSPLPGVAVTTRVTGLEPAPRLPAASAAVPVRTLFPSASGVVGVKLKRPSVPASAVPSTVPLSAMVTVAPASAVPVMVGVVSVVGARASNTGAPGAVRSITRGVAAEAGEALPAASTATAVRLAVPSGRAAGVRLKLPSVPATVEPIWVVPFETMTVAPGSAVPVITGVVSLVGATKAVMLGAFGATLSMVRATAAEGAETLPARSCAVTVMLLVP